MTDKYEQELEKTEALFHFLQGVVPDGITIPEEKVPRLTADQAWAVVWYLGNLYWQVPDCIERCGVCGELYHTSTEGDYLHYGDAPHFFCGSCEDSDEYRAKNKMERRDD